MRVGGVWKEQRRGQGEVPVRTYQLESACCHDIPLWTVLPLITISQRRMVLAITGMRPMEKMTISAATLCQDCPYKMSH